jgi:hypothetical protein
MDTRSRLSPVTALALPLTANAVVLVQTSDPGFYNHSVGTILNNTNGGNFSTGYFPINNDATEPCINSRGYKK